MGTRDGGKPIQHDVRNYSPPKGPTNINDPKGPGLHGENYGSGSQGFSNPLKGGASGSPGLHGTNKGNDGSQR